MPQTIALQRGTTTVSGNGSSFATLFTQSGGIATRVIVNQLSFSFSNQLNAQSTLAGALYLQSSGGQGSVLGQLFRGDNPSNARSAQFVVGSYTNSPYMGGLVSSTGILGPVTPMLMTQDTDMSVAAPANVQVNYSSNNQVRYSMLAQNFYIGPGDALRIKFNALFQSGKSGSPATVTISYSFTTITET